jgi:hypothetical protein
MFCVNCVLLLAHDITWFNFHSWNGFLLLLLVQGITAVVDENLAAVDCSTKERRPSSMNNPEGTNARTSPQKLLQSIPVQKSAAMLDSKLLTSTPPPLLPRKSWIAGDIVKHSANKHFRPVPIPTNSETCNEADSSAGKQLAPLVIVDNEYLTNASADIKSSQTSDEENDEQIALVEARLSSSTPGLVARSVDSFDTD